MKSNGQAELRRSYEQLVDAYHALEKDAAKLREQNEALRNGRKPEPVKLASVEVVKQPSEGSFVDWVDKKGVAHLAHVLEVRKNDVLKLRVWRTAVPNVDVVCKRAASDSDREVWRPR